MEARDPNWFTRFSIVPEDRSDDEIVWANIPVVPRAPAEPTRAQGWSILLIGIVAIAGLVIMVLTLLVAIYLSRR